MHITYICALVIYKMADILVTLICVEAIMSWFVGSFNGTLVRVYEFIRMITEPVVSPFRRLTQRYAYNMGIDFSPILAIFALQIGARLLASIVLSL